MSKRKIVDIGLIILIVTLLLFMGFVYNFMKSNAKECLSDPMEYMEEKNENVVCQCFVPNRFVDE